MSTDRTTVKELMAISYSFIGCNIRDGELNCQEILADNPLDDNFFISYYQRIQ